MAIRKVWFGSLGPFFYDDAVTVIDPDGVVTEYQAGVVVDGQITVINPPLSLTDVVRLEDLDGALEVIEPGTANGQLLYWDNTAGAWKHTETTELVWDDTTKSITLSGFLTSKKVGVYAFLSAYANTTITTADAFYPISGTFTNGPTENFGAATTYTPGIKYTGTMTQWFEIDWHASLSANVADTTVKLGIKKNGALVAGSVMGQFLKNADQMYNLSGTCVVELSLNDEIQLVITSDGDGDIITMYYYTTTINEFFD